MIPKMKMFPDEQLREQVISEIESDPALRSAEIIVAAERGLITLTGSVESYPEKLGAEEAAKRVAGVRAVANDLEIKPGLMRTDPDIARDIMAALKTNPEVPFDRIKVTVVDGFVTLEGSVDQQFQRLAAESAVRNLAGIRSIHNRISIIGKLAPVEVTDRIEEALTRIAELEARRIRVEVKDSRVSLYGTVRSWEEKYAAERAAWSVAGIVDVESHLTVTP